MAPSHAVAFLLPVASKFHKHDARRESFDAALEWDVGARPPRAVSDE